jgi:acid phosphatase type 7
MVNITRRGALAAFAAPIITGCRGLDLTAPSFATSSLGSVALVGAGDPHAQLANKAHDIGRMILAALDAEPTAWAFALGDLVTNGTADEYRQFYERAWGSFKSRTLFQIGNHDRKADPAAIAYYDYVGELGGERGRGYYARTLGAWRCYFLNSERLHSEQAAWLATDLPQWSNYHIMAMWHTPMFASVCQHAGRAMTWPGALGPWWSVLQQHGAELVLSGHVHRYERFSRMLRDGTRSDRGVRQFIIGTGGAKPMPILSLHRNSERQMVTRGMFRLDLRPDRYEWRFTDVTGAVQDSGIQQCRKVISA